MKITKQELRKIIMEELENEVKSLNEYYPGMTPEDQIEYDRQEYAAKQREKAEKNAAEDKRKAAIKDRAEGEKDYRSKRLNKSKLNNEDYMSGYLDLRLLTLETELDRLAPKVKKIIGPYKYIPKYRAIRARYNNFDMEKKAIEDGSWVKKYGKKR